MFELRNPRNASPARPILVCTAADAGDGRRFDPTAVRMSVAGGTFALLLCLGFVSAAASGAADAGGLGDGDEEAVAAMIEQLGHPNYAARVRARENLERMGLQAFDSLHAAQYHWDSEIAMTARYLVSSLLVQWSDETDPPAVREALDEYGAQSESERQKRIDRLAELSGGQGLPALARLARFEPSMRLSREAALAVMRSPRGEDEAERQSWAAAILEVLGSNNREASQWLRLYAGDLKSGEYSAADWQQLVARQRAAVDSGTDAATTRPAVLELIRVSATHAVAAGHADEALELFSKNLDLIPPRSREVVEACNWAIDNEMHALVLELYKRYPDLFARRPILLYNAAEATLVAGEGREAAEAMADRAAAIDPLPQPGTAEAEKMSPKALEELAYRHRETASELATRGLFHWAEREFRGIIDAVPEESSIGALVRWQLAGMLGELLRHDEVVEVLEPVVTRTDEDQQFQRRLQAQQLNLSRLKSTMLFHRGLAQVEALKQDDADEEALESARRSFVEALELDPINIDILIEMYRLEGDERWQNDVRKRIRSIAATFENQIEAMRIQLGRQIRFPDMAEHLANYYNQYAWLISNTEGDYDKALRFSLKSLELDPDNWAQLDTAGRCYFALGDLENALRMQRRAVKLMPHSPPLVRQLAEFEAAAREAESAEGSASGKKAAPALQ